MTIRHRKFIRLSATSGLAGALACLAMPVAAQTAADSPAQERASDGATDRSDIVVTGSRIDRPGFESPTPVLRVTSEDLAVIQRPNIGAALADLPQFKAGQSPQTSGTNAQAGRFPVDLRGLGAVRTLLLLDGRRFASDNDLNTIPSILVKNVDIVTGGASAAWGSGAVAGVVNITLDDKLNGFRLAGEAGVSVYGDAGQRQLQAAFGTSFADGRGRFIVGGEFFQSDGITPKTSRPNTGRWVTIPNATGLATLTPNVGYANALVGGIITSGVLQGQVFNPDGTLRTANLGRVSGTNSIGGEAPSDDDLSPLAPPAKRVAGMARVAYDMLDNLTVSADLRYSRYFDDYTWFGDHTRAVTISRDNAFLRPDIRARLVAAGQTTFTLGRYNSDLSYTRIDVRRQALQGTLALKGSFDQNRWRWDAYYTHGEYRNDIDTPGFLLRNNFNNAVDAVISPTTGQPVCRIALTTPTTDCVPLNLFGYGAPSQAAINYVTGTPSQRSISKLDVVAASIRGEPFELWAGPVSVAAGVEARWESVESRAGDLDRAGAFLSFNFGQLFGKDSVKEGFAELLVPLAKDIPLLRKLELNGAVRVSDYRNSGSIWSWKVGATNEFVPGVIGRVTLSRDIRAPTLSELYSTRTISGTRILDPQTNQSVAITSYGGGNSALKPERGHTLTAGVTTALLPGLTASIDYFDIKITDIIAGISAQDLVTRCFNGNTALCARVTRDSTGTVISTESTPANLAEYKTNGIDAELAYRLPIGGSRKLDFRVLGTWVDSLTTNDGVSKVEYVGITGYAFVNGVPSWRVNGSVGYSDDTFNAVVRGRYVSPGEFNIVPTTNSHIPAYTYVDLQLGARVPAGNRSIEVYGSVSNLFNKEPPVGSMFSPFYDVVGRYTSVGARVRF